MLSLVRFCSIPHTCTGLAAKLTGTSIVAERLKAEGKQEIFRACVKTANPSPLFANLNLLLPYREEMEELEDEEGNVYNKKVYNDLKAQGERRSGRWLILRTTDRGSLQAFCKMHVHFHRSIYVAAIMFLLAHSNESFTYHSGHSRQSLMRCDLGEVAY